MPGWTSELYTWYLQSDFQSELISEAEDLGFRIAPRFFDIIEVRWDGDFAPLDDATTNDEGLVLAAYDLGQTAEFEAEFPAGVEIAPGWRSSGPDAWGRIRVEVSIEMLVRIAVLFGGTYSFTVEELAWRRRDGSRQGATAHRIEPPSQPTLFG